MNSSHLLSLSDMHSVYNSTTVSHLAQQPYQHTIKPISTSNYAYEPSQKQYFLNDKNEIQKWIPLGHYSTIHLRDDCGDKLANLNLILELPALKAHPPTNNRNLDSSLVTAHYTNAVGQFIPKRISLFLAGIYQYSLYNVSMFIEKNFTDPSLMEMIGDRQNDTLLLLEDAKEIQHLCIPIPFFFTESPDKALNLRNIDKNGGVSLVIEWENLENCIVTGAPGVIVTKEDDSELTNQDIIGWVDATYIHCSLEHQNSQ